MATSRSVTPITVTLRERLAPALSLLADRIGGVLTDGDIDDESRGELVVVRRVLKEAAAGFAELAATGERQIERRAEVQRQRAELDERVREQREREHAWRRTPRPERDAVLLRALGDDRLTIRELTARVNAELGAPHEKWATVYKSTVGSMARRMSAAALLHRVPEPFQGKTRYRYVRNVNSEAVA